jgi:aspartate--ammonia ligase
VVRRQTPRGGMGIRETQDAIKFMKDGFERRLATALNLRRVSAPLFVSSASGLNDHLTGVEKPIRFRVKDTGEDAEIVQSLAKWKRMALADYGFRQGEGLYTDMNAIRPEERLDALHSIYVDQWDWERVMAPGERNLEFLRSVVRKIYGAIRAMERATCQRYPRLPGPYLPRSIRFVHGEDLAARFPGLDPRAREDAVCRDEGAVFVIGIGAPLADGRPHDGRAADYDDWTTETGGGRRGLNGDILVWYPPLGRAVELSSMGIRVDPEALRRQLALKGEEASARLPFHRRLLAGELPQTIGGGLGQSRLCMVFLRKRHIGEVQASLWPADVRAKCRGRGIELL